MPARFALVLGKPVAGSAVWSKVDVEKLAEIMSAQLQQVVEDEFLPRSRRNASKPASDKFTAAQDQMLIF